jgi:GAF domain-containing protein
MSFSDQPKSENTMSSEPNLTKEQRRQAAVDRLRILDSGEDRAYDDLTRLAASLLGTPMALVSVLDRDRQWFKSRVGMQATQTPREHAFCDHAIRTPDRVFAVEDAAIDPRFSNNPLVTGDPGIRAYLGVPLVVHGEPLGTLCVLDTQPRQFESQAVGELQRLARAVVHELEARARDTGQPR